MPPSDGARAFQQATTEGPRLLLTCEVTPGYAALTGRWLASGDYVEVER